MTQNEHKPVPVGALARITEDHQGIDKFYYKGDTFVVEQYVSAEENTEPQAPGAYYMGSDNNGYFNIEIDAEYVEMLLTPEETKNRKIPDLDRVASDVQSAVIGISNGEYDIHTADAEGEGVVSFSGTTTEGLDFVFDVTVRNLDKTSW